MEWRLMILGEPCAKGTAETEQECIRLARLALEARSDYAAILNLARVGVPVSVHICTTLHQNPSELA